MPSKSDSEPVDHRPGCTAPGRGRSSPPYLPANKCIIWYTSMIVIESEKIVHSKLQHSDKYSTIWVEQPRGELKNESNILNASEEKNTWITSTKVAKTGIHASPDEPQNKEQIWIKVIKGWQIITSWWGAGIQGVESELTAEEIYDDKRVGNYRDRRLEAMGRTEGRERLIVAEWMSGRTQRRKQIKTKEKQKEREELRKLSKRWCQEIQRLTLLTKTDPCSCKAVSIICIPSSTFSSSSLLPTTCTPRGRPCIFSAS